MLSRVGQPAGEERLVHFQITPPKGASSHFVVDSSTALSVSPDEQFITYKALIAASLKRPVRVHQRQTGRISAII